MVAGVLLVALGTVGLLSALGVEIPLAVAAPAVLVVVGVGLIVSAVRGAPASGAVSLAIAAGVVLAAVSLVGSLVTVPLHGAVGERSHRPATVSEVDPSYRLLMGAVDLDLSEVELPAGTTTVEASTVLGEVVVRVPADAEVSVEADVGGGEATVLGVTREGLAVDNDRETAGYDDAGARLRLRVGAALGEVRVMR